MQLAVRLGYHAIGFMFVEKSSRHIDLATAKKLCTAITPLTNLFAVFMNPSRREVLEVLSAIPCNTLQFHGEETEKFCSSFKTPYIKSIPMKTVGFNHVGTFMSHYPGARGFVLDSNQSGEMGGTGKRFKWKKIPLTYQSKIILSGGLDQDNILDARNHTKTFQYDLSSGLESKGKKDLNKIKYLIRLLHEESIQNI